MNVGVSEEQIKRREYAEGRIEEGKAMLDQLAIETCPFKINCIIRDRKGADYVVVSVEWARNAGGWWEMFYQRVDIKGPMHSKAQHDMENNEFAIVREPLVMNAVEGMTIADDDIKLGGKIGQPAKLTSEA